MLFRAPVKLMAISLEQIYGMLDKPNPDYMVNIWNVISTKKDLRGCTFVFLVDDLAVEEIRDLECRAHIGLWHVYIVIMTGMEYANDPSDKTPE